MTLHIVPPADKDECPALPSLRAADVLALVHYIEHRAFTARDEADAAQVCGASLVEAKALGEADALLKLAMALGGSLKR